MSKQKGVNEDFFKKWSHDMSYVLGFFMADGSMEIGSRKSYYISFHILDRELLFKIRKTMCSGHKIARRKGRKGQSDLYRMQIGSKTICMDLQLLGVTNSKTLNMEIPDIPECYFGDFVRGYFDGDGNVWSGFIHKDRKKRNLTLQTAFTSSSKGFLEGLKRELARRNIKGSLACGKGFFRLSYSMFGSLALYKLMYGRCDSSLYLPRKRQVFEKFIEYRKNMHP